MGNGRSLSAKRRTTPVQPTQQAQQQVAAQAPTPQNTPVVSNALQALTDMDDAQLAAVYMDSRLADMPNQLADLRDATQAFVYTIGLNDKPMVLDSSAFSQYMSDNGLNQGDIISRSVNGVTYTNQSGTNISMSAEDVADMMMYSRLNYIGGKRGGQMLGGGMYFARTTGSTGYGGHTVNAVLNPQTARVVSYTTLARQARNFDSTHPLFRQQTGGFGNRDNESIYALAMGYNVITDGSGYYNVIDRKALVFRKA